MDKLCSFQLSQKQNKLAMFKYSHCFHTYYVVFQAAGVPLLQVICSLCVGTFEETKTHN